MALIIEAVNISELAPVSDYAVLVCINDRVIARLLVTGHVRALGWRELLRKIADTKEKRT